MSASKIIANESIPLSNAYVDKAWVEHCHANKFHTGADVQNPSMRCHWAERVDDEAQGMHGNVIVKLGIGVYQDPGHLRSMKKLCMLKSMSGIGRD